MRNLQTLLQQGQLLMRRLEAQAEQQLQAVSGETVRGLRAVWDELETHLSASGEEQILGFDAPELALLEHFPTPVWRSGVDSQCNYLNQTWLDFRGRTLEQELDEGWIEGLHPLDRESCFQTYQSAFGARQPFFMEYRLLHGDGSFRWVSDQGQPFYDSQGQFAGFIGSCFDITARKEAERALHEREARFRRVFEDGPLGMALVDFDFRLLQVNARFCDLLGYTPAELQSRFVQDITHPDDIHLDSGLLQQLMAGGSHYTIEKRYLKKNGEVIQGKLTVSLIQDDNRSRHCLLGMVEDISAQRGAELALQKSEARFAAFMDNSPALAFIRDKEGHYVYVNKSLETELRVSREELKSKSLFDCLAAPVAKQLRRDDLQVLESGRPMQFEEVIPDHEGVERTWLASKFPMSDGNGELLVAGMLVDVTERKRAESELRERERHLRTLMDTAHEGIWVLDVESKTRYCNARLLEMLGYSSPEVLGQPVTNFVFEEDVERIQAQLEGRRGVEAQYDFRFKRKDGSAVWVLVCGSPIENEEGVVTGTLEMLTDITGRKRAEEQLRQSEVRYRSLFDLSPLPTVVFDDETRAFVAVNNAAVEHYGYSRDEFLSMTLWDLHLPEDAPFERETTVPSTGKGEGHMIRHRKKDGTTFFTNIVTDALLLDGRRVRLAVINDITEQIQAREAQHQYTQRLQILRDTDQAILAAKSPQTVAEAAVQRILALLPCQRATVTKVDIETQKFTVLATHSRAGSARLSDLPIELDALSLSHLPFLQEEAICDYGDLRDIDSPPRWIETLQSEGIRSGIAVPLIAAGELIGSLNLWSQKPHVFSDDEREIAREVASSLAIAIHQASLHRQVLESRRGLQALSLQLVEVQEAERRNLARELHDQIGQDLTALKMALETPNRGTAPTANTLLPRQMVNDLMARVRELSFDLRPAMLDDLGLVPALLWLFEHFGKQTGIEVVFKHGSIANRFDHRSETAAFRVVQEALTNVARHAGVGEATVRLWANAGVVGVQIEDKGRGFDAAELLQGKTLGLASMRERAALLGGTLSLESSAGTGTRVLAEFPLAGELQPPELSQSE